MNRLVSLLFLHFPELRKHLCKYQGAPKDKGCPYTVVKGEGVFEVKNGDDQTDELAQCDDQCHRQ